MKKRHYVPALLIIITIIVSVYYVFFKDNEIETQLDRGRYILQQRIRNIELDRFPSRLQLEFERLIRDFNNIQLRIDWTAELDFDITLQPVFDLRNIYLVSFNKIAVYNKNDMTSVWIKQFDNDIESISLLDGNNIMLIDIRGLVHVINRNNGDLNWRYNLDVNNYFSSFDIGAPRPIQITYNEDKRLITSIVFITVNNEINILCSITGEVFYRLILDDFIYFISDYDQMTNSVYVSYGNNIAKIILDKR